MNAERMNRLESFLCTVLEERDVSIPEIDVKLTMPCPHTAMLMRRIIGRLRRELGPIKFPAYAADEWGACRAQPLIVAPVAPLLPIEGYGDEFGDWRGDDSLSEHAEAIARRHNL